MNDLVFRSMPRIYYVAFPSLDPERPLTVAAQLRLPRSSAPVPAVVIVHGTSGVDSRGSYHAEALNEAGIATFEIDLWGARGLAGGVEGRPAGVIETLPDAYGALAWLSAHPAIDAAHIGITGYSWGGVVSMLTATRFYTRQFMGQSGLRFAAHVPFYPVCWVYNTMPGYEFGHLTGAPVLILTGALDTYEAANTCPNLVQQLAPADRSCVEAIVYPDATHAFNRLEPAITAYDPYANFGQGGEVLFAPNPDAAADSRLRTVRFFQHAFGMLADPDQSRRECA